MPVFHTKTIESILEPVAQQISKLVILHEEADDGNEMPDLSLAVQIVRQAADNLIKVGYETTENSNDLILRNEIPNALSRVEEACYLLQEAAVILKIEPKSPIGKRNLISGERGILQGVSAILLTFDESEVRKIVRVCNQVLEYLSITELIEKMDDLVTYVRNLTPILTKMTREIDTREKELTHQAHRDLLAQHLEQVKNLTPVFISSIKISLIINDELLVNKKNDDRLNQIKSCIEQSKEFLIRRLSDEINQMIRILQLTTFDEDECSDDLTLFMKQKLNMYEMKYKIAMQWLSDLKAQCGGMGEKSTRNLVEDAIAIANKLEQDHNSKDAILTYSNNIKTLMNNLCALINEQKRESSYAIRTSATIIGNLLSLRDLLKDLINKAGQDCVTKPANTLNGKIDQANKWFDNPNNNIIGEKAIKLIIEEGRSLALSQKDLNLREDFIQFSQNYESMIEKLFSLDKQIGLKKDVEKLNITRFSLSKQLSDKLNILTSKINKLVIEQVADDFVDISYPLKKLNEVIKSSSRDFNFLEEKFQKCSNEFLNFTFKLCQTANKVAASSTQSSQKNLEMIKEFTRRNEELAPEVVNAGYIALIMKDKKDCMENFDLLRHQWQKNMEILQKLVDESLDCELFIDACEKQIINETFKTQTAVQENNSQAIVLNTLNIAKRSNRIMQVAQQEAENSEDSSYVNLILKANEKLRQSLAPIIHCSKTLAVEPNNKDAYLKWTDSNEKLIDSISNIKNAVNNQTNNIFASCSDNNSSLSSINDFEEPIYLNNSQSSSIKLSIDYFDEKNDNNHLISSYPKIESLRIVEEFKKIDQNNTVQPKFQVTARNCRQIVSKPTPLPDVIEENETEFPLPQSNQPILMAAHDLHLNVNQWYSTDNDMIAVAKRITLLMARLSELVKGGAGGTGKKDLIATARQLADESLEISKLAKELATNCTDKRMRQNLLQVSERIPTIGTQLKILSTVKATMLGSQASKEDEEATDMLIGNAQNLNASVKATVQAAKSASIKIRTDSGIKLRWVRKSPPLVKIK